MNLPERKKSSHQGFTLVELLFVVVIAFMLLGLSSAVYSSIQNRARAIQSASNLHQLALANINYAADNGGQFCPAQDKRNQKRWHGARGSSGGKFDPSKGYLAPYISGDGRVKKCPLLIDVLDASEGSWEDGTGGYGYNATYVGGSYATTGKFYIPEYADRITHPVRTVMFTTSALAKGGGLQEYAYSEPFNSVRKGGDLGGSLQPSTHFRANGKAIVAWCDAHVTFEPMNKNVEGQNFFGGDNEKASIGWFGPKEQNGYWNPYADRSIFY